MFLLGFVITNITWIGHLFYHVILRVNKMKLFVVKLAIKFIFWLRSPNIFQFQLDYYTCHKSISWSASNWSFSCCFRIHYSNRLWWNKGERESDINLSLSPLCSFTEYYICGSRKSGTGIVQTNYVQRLRASLVHYIINQNLLLYFWHRCKYPIIHSTLKIADTSHWAIVLPGRLIKCNANPVPDESE